MSVREPAFRIQLRDRHFEVRDYPPLVVAEVVVAGDQSHAAGQGFHVEAKTAELNAWIGARRLRRWAPARAQCDPPWTLWSLRRNEVMIPVAA